MWAALGGAALNSMGGGMGGGAAAAPGDVVKSGDVKSETNVTQGNITFGAKSALSDPVLIVGIAAVAVVGLLAVLRR